jgi:hypothetical protein
MTKSKKQNREQKKEKKTILEKKWGLSSFSKLQNLHLIKQKYKFFFKIIFIRKELEKLEFFEKEKRNK